MMSVCVSVCLVQRLAHHLSVIGMANLMCVQAWAVLLNAAVVTLSGDWLCVYCHMCVSQQLWLSASDEVLCSNSNNINISDSTAASCIATLV